MNTKALKQIRRNQRAIKRIRAAFEWVNECYIGLYGVTLTTGLILALIVKLTFNL